MGLASPSAATQAMMESSPRHSSSKAHMIDDVSAGWNSMDRQSLSIQNLVSGTLVRSLDSPYIGAHGPLPVAAASLVSTRLKHKNHPQCAHEPDRQHQVGDSGNLAPEVEVECFFAGESTSEGVPRATSKRKKKARRSISYDFGFSQQQLPAAPPAASEKTDKVVRSHRRSRSLSIRPYFQLSSAEAILRPQVKIASLQPPPPPRQSCSQHFIPAISTVLAQEV